MAQTPLAPPPPSGNNILDRWMYLLWRRLNQAGQILWNVVDKTGSNLTDIETRNHADLQNHNTADYYHLTQTNHTDLTDGGATTLHKHDHGNLDGLSDDDHTQYVLVSDLEIDRATVSANWDDLTDGNLTELHQHDFTKVQYPAIYKVGTPAHIDTLHEVYSHESSSGVMHGCNITDNGNGTVSFSSGYATLRAVADSHTPLYAVEVAAQNNLALTDQTTNYIYLDWNGGNPQFVAGTSITSFNCLDKCIAYAAFRDGNSVIWIDAREQNVDGNRKSRQLFLKFSKFIHADGGTVLGGSGLAVTLTAGEFFFMLQSIPHEAFDTTVAGTANANIFKSWYRDGIGGWVGTIEQKTVSSTLYDDGTGTLATIGNNKYGVVWFYLVQNDPSELHAVIGQAEYANAADALAASPPAEIPPIVDGLGSLVGFVTFQKSATSFTNVLSAFSQVFSASAATNHNGLAGLQGGAVNEYYHFTAAQHTDLTDGGDSTLHYHATDRNADNHVSGTTNKVFTATEQTKLSGIEAGAEVNNISDTDATDLTDGGDTTLHSHAAFTGDSGSGGVKGMVPAPSAGDATKYLKGDGTWATVSAGGGASYAYAARH